MICLPSKAQLCQTNFSVRMGNIVSKKVTLTVVTLTVVSLTITLVNLTLVTLTVVTLTLVTLTAVTLTAVTLTAVILTIVSVVVVTLGELHFHIVLLFVSVPVFYITWFSVLKLDTYSKLNRNDRLRNCLGFVL